MEIRPIVQISQSVPTLEGAGVRLRRAFGFNHPERYDPFLLLDDFRGDNPEHYTAGFPMHPHRGIQTVTYMLEGRVEHQDSLGNKGVIGPGGVQWMTSGSGIIHEEMPAGDHEGRMYGFQLWVNLPARLKMSEPLYQEFLPDEIPVVTEAGKTEVRIICGRYKDTEGPVKVSGTDPSYFDVKLHPETDEIFNIQPEHNVVIYVYEGDLLIPASASGDDKGSTAKNRDLLLFGPGDSLRLRAGAAGASFLLISGLPIKEPIAWRGPIVMNTQEELSDAFAALHEGTFLREQRG